MLFLLSLKEIDHRTFPCASNRVLEKPGRGRAPPEVRDPLRTAGFLDKRARIRPEIQLSRA